MSTAEDDSTQDEGSRKPGVTLLEVLVAVIVVGVVLGVLAAVLVPKIIHRRRLRRREFAAASALVEIIRARLPEQYGPAPMSEGNMGYWGRRFLEWGVDSEAEIQCGGTPLHAAVLSGDKDEPEVLLADGADVNVKDFFQSTPLHWVAILGHKDVAELLLANGADVNAKDKDGLTPLAVAEGQVHTELVELLKKNMAQQSD